MGIQPLTSLQARGGTGVRPRFGSGDVGKTDLGRADEDEKLTMLKTLRMGNRSLDFAEKVGLIRTLALDLRSATVRGAAFWAALGLPKKDQGALMHHVATQRARNPMAYGDDDFTRRAESKGVADQMAAMAGWINEYAQLLGKGYFSQTDKPREVQAPDDDEEDDPGRAIAEALYGYWLG